MGPLFSWCFRISQENWFWRGQLDRCASYGRLHTYCCSFVVPLAEPSAEAVGGTAICVRPRHEDQASRTWNGVLTLGAVFTIFVSSNLDLESETLIVQAYEHIHEAVRGWFFITRIYEVPAQKTTSAEFFFQFRWIGIGNLFVGPQARTSSLRYATTPIACYR